LPVSTCGNKNIEMKGFVFRLIPPRSDFPFTMTEVERATMTEHVAYWMTQMEEGKVLAFGPVNDPAEPYGLGLVLAEDLSAAEALRDDDPVMTSGIGFRTEIAAALQLVTPGGTYLGM
jgi:uncharacterized protein YciI